MMMMKMVDHVSMAMIGIIIQTLVTKSRAGLFNGIYFDIPEDKESTMVHDVIHLISRQKWTSPVIFTDNLRVTLYQKLLTKLTTEEGNSSSYPLTFNMSTMATNELENHLDGIYQLYNRKIPLLLLCSLKNSEHILSTANAIGERTRGLLDYKHRSHWLVVAGISWLEAIRNASSQLENVAVLPYRTDSSRRHKSDELFKKDIFIDCNVVCEEQFISTALGTTHSRHWKWRSYDDVHNSKNSDDLELLLFPNTAYGYNGHELLVATIVDPPYLERTTDANETIYSGFCFDVFHLMIKSLNFRVLPYNDLDWGVMYKDSGNWSGIVGELQRRNADVAVTSLWIEEQRSKAIDYVEPGIGTFKMVFLYRSTSLDTDLSLLSFLDPFKTNVYLLIIGILLTVPLFFYIIETHLIEENNKGQLRDVYFHFMGILFQQGGSMRPVSWTARAVVSTFWLCSICLAASYSAYLTASLTTNSEIQPFSSIKELLQRDDYKIGIHGHNIHILSNAKKGLLMDVWQKILKSNRSDPTVFEQDRRRFTKKILTERFALVTRERYATEMVSNTCDLSILPEVLHVERLAFALSKGSPYLTDFEHKMRHLWDSGTVRHLEEGSADRQTKCERMKSRTVSMNYMLGKLSLLVLGSVIATLSLTTEFVARRIHMRVNTVRKPNPISKLKR